MLVVVVARCLDMYCKQFNERRLPVQMQLQRGRRSVALVMRLSGKTKLNSLNVALRHRGG